MSVDRRVRDALRRTAERTGRDRDLAGPLASVERRGIRARRVRHAMNVSILAASLVLVAILGPGILREIRSDRALSPPVSSLTPTDPYQRVAGTYTVRLSVGSSLVSQTGTAGAWIIRLGPGGELTLIGPSSFASAPVYSTYALDGDRFSTSAFSGQAGCSASIGSYRFTRTTSDLTLQPITETCDIRRAVFGSMPLTPRVPSPVDGVWTTHTVAARAQSSEIRSAGFPASFVGKFLADQQETRSIVYTLRFQDGIFQTLAAADGRPAQAIDAGSYSVSADRITIRPFAGSLTVWRFSLVGDRLELALVRDTQPPHAGMPDAVFQHGIYTAAPFFRSS
jgi:hypothetical protein